MAEPDQNMEFEDAEPSENIQAFENAGPLQNIPEFEDAGSSKHISVFEAAGPSQDIPDFDFSGYSENFLEFEAAGVSRNYYEDSRSSQSSMHCKNPEPSQIIVRNLSKSEIERRERCKQAIRRCNFPEARTIELITAIDEFPGFQCFPPVKPPEPQNEVPPPNFLLSARPRQNIVESQDEESAQNGPQCEESFQSTPQCEESVQNTPQCEESAQNTPQCEESVQNTPQCEESDQNTLQCAETVHSTLSDLTSDLPVSEESDPNLPADWKILQALEDTLHKLRESAKPGSSIPIKT